MLINNLFQVRHFKGDFFTENQLNKKINITLFYLLSLLLISPENYLSFSNYPAGLYCPAGVFLFFNEPGIFSKEIIFYLSLLWRLSAFFCAFDFLFSFFSKVHFLILFLFFSISNNYGWQTHSTMPIVLVSLVLAFETKNITFLIRFIFCSVFFTAGLSKFRNSGIQWALSESFQNMLIRSEIYYHDTFVFIHGLNLNRILLKNEIVAKCAAVISFCLEICAPAALFSKKLSGFVVVSLFLMQILIYFTIFVNFQYYILLYIFWIDWDRLLKFIYTLKPLRIF